MNQHRITGAWRPQSDSLGPRRILVVEDSLVQRLSLQLLLDGFGYAVDQAANGAEANAYLAETLPDAVLLDWQLPDATGPELLALDPRPRLQWVPVLMLTGHDEAEKVRDALDAGAADCLRKPPNGIELHARLRNALRLKDLQDQMRHLAQRDALTSLWNRHVALDRLGRMLRGDGSAPTMQVAVALIDVDHFKAVNDNHGHDAGDAVLIAVARHLEATLGDPAMARGSVCRFGGEEFLAILPDHDVETAVEAVEAARRALLAAQIPLPSGQTLAVNFSAGVAHVSCGQGANAKALLKQADVALYEAKAQGRGRVLRAG